MKLLNRISVLVVAVYVLVFTATTIALKPHDQAPSPSERHNASTQTMQQDAVEQHPSDTGLNPTTPTPFDYYGVDVDPKRLEAIGRLA